jgi:hypothetical protein
MDGSSSKERLVNWRLAGRRLRRPLPWVALGLLLLGGLGGVAGARWWDSARSEPPPDGFRFEEVFVVEGSTRGNLSELKIVPWMSNGGHESLGTMRLVVYVLESERNLVRNESTLDVGRIPGRRTVNVSAPFELNNTRAYQIQILAFEDDYLVGRGYGSIGFERMYYWDAAEGDALTAVTLNASRFNYDYGRP